MARRVTRRQGRYQELRLHNFLPLEARELSKLPKSTPALKLLVQERDARRARFERIAAAKIAMGRWRRTQVADKWIKNLSRMYSKLHARVRFGATGKQQPMPKGSPNPWALYRDAGKKAPPKRWKSPWEIRQITGGKTPLAKGLIFVQRLEQKAAGGGVVNKREVQRALAETGEARERARGKRRAQLEIEYRRLEKLL